MDRHDWLADGDRRELAVERIYTAANELITRDGMDAFDIDTLAAQVHCSRATVYRHVGGRAAVLDAVLARTSARIIATVRSAVDGREGADRVLTAVTVAVREIRIDAMGDLFARSARGATKTEWLTESPAVSRFAAELAGLAGDDPMAAEWIVRLVLCLIFWPGESAEREFNLLQRFVAPSFQ